MTGVQTCALPISETAGSLVNLGKILVPPELLTKSGSLSDAERKLIADSMAAAPDLIARVEFEGPVADALRQVHERWDGKGRPSGSSGEAILMSARIVAVANAFVALLSPRAWRAGVGFDAALEALQRDAGAAYDHVGRAC